MVGRQRGPGYRCFEKFKLGHGPRFPPGDRVVTSLERAEEIVADGEAALRSHTSWNCNIDIAKSHPVTVRIGKIQLSLM